MKVGSFLANATVDLPGSPGVGGIESFTFDGLEAFSIATVEAASMGLPLLLSDRVGTREALTGEDFSGYPALDTAALVAAARLLARAAS